MHAWESSLAAFNNYWFALDGALITTALHILKKVAIIYYVKSALIAKLGGSSNMASCVEVVSLKWPKEEAWQSYSLKEIHERMVKASAHGHGGGHGGSGGHAKGISLSSVAATLNVANVLKAKASSASDSASGGGGQATAAPLTAAKFGKAAARLAALERPSKAHGHALPFHATLATPGSSSSSNSSSAAADAAGAGAGTTPPRGNSIRAKLKKQGFRLSAVGRHTSLEPGQKANLTQNLEAALGVDPSDVAKFQAFYMLWLRVTNVFQAFYISLILAHWAWFAPSHAQAVAMVLPLAVIYLIFTPLLVNVNESAATLRQFKGGGLF
jgi:hypothetical protein